VAEASVSANNVLSHFLSCWKEAWLSPCRALVGRLQAIRRRLLSLPCDIALLVLQRRSLSLGSVIAFLTIFSASSRDEVLVVRVEARSPDRYSAVVRSWLSRGHVAVQHS
jgi:hypothetical protein